MTTGSNTKPNYYAFGMAIQGRKFSGSSGYRYGMNGQEKDNEIAEGIYTAEFLEYDSRLGRRWNIDPVVFDDLSLYSVFANNPILFNDVAGNTFTVGLGDQTKSDVTGLVKAKNEQYVKIDDKTGTVRLDFGSINKKEQQKILDKDEGLSLINDLVKSPKKFYYEATEASEVTVEGINSSWFAARDNNGVMNASNNGKDSNKGNLLTSAKGYDGEVLVSSKGTWQETDITGMSTVLRKSRSSIIFHELVENYERTHNGIDYNGSKKFPFGAHSLSAKREVSWWNKSDNPGGYAGYKNPDSKLNLIQLNEKYFPEKIKK